MLGSSYDGERANAGRMADELVRGLGLTWEQVVADGTAGSRQHASPPHGGWQRASDHRDAAAACRDSGHAWNEWEEGFLASVGRRWSLSEKQERVLRRLCR